MAHDTTRETKRARCPEAVLGWIPWYASGGLSARENGAVEAHAAECADCRSELDIVAGAPWAVEGIELPDADRLFGEISARIDTETQKDRATVIPISRGRALSAEDMTRLERWVLDPGSEAEADSRSEPDFGVDLDRGVSRASATASASSPREESERPRRRRMDVFRSPLWAAAAALIVFIVGGIGGAAFESLRSAVTPEGADDPAAYQLASVTPASDAEPSAPMLDVVFSDSASAREIWSALRELGVEIVAGPSNLGVYRLRLLPAATENRVPTPADAAAISARLVAPGSTLAIFAEPVP